MSTEQTNFRIDKEIKHRAYEILEDIGLKPSEAVNMFFKRVTLERGIPFSTKLPSKSLLKALQEERSKGNLWSADDYFTNLDREIEKQAKSNEANQGKDSL